MDWPHLVPYTGRALAVRRYLLLHTVRACGLRIICVSLLIDMYRYAYGERTAALSLFATNQHQSRAPSSIGSL